MCLEKILGIKGASVPLSLFLRLREGIFRNFLSPTVCLRARRGKAFRFNSQFPSREGEMFETLDRNFGGFVNLDLTSIFDIFFLFLKLIIKIREKILD